MDTKVCRKCGEKKELKEFNKRVRGASGVQGQCRFCKNARRRRFYGVNKESRERDNFRANRWKKINASRNKKYLREWRKRNSIRIKKYAEFYRKNKMRLEHNKANWTLRYAVKRGKLIKSFVCERCGAKGYTEGHHADYSKPLVVSWLCVPCHRYTHTKDKYKELLS